MNILALADAAPRKSITELLSEQSVDLIVTLGDLDLFILRDLENVTIPKVGVYGNHCSGHYFEPLGILNLHMCTWNFGGLTWGGFQGCVRYKDNPNAIMCTQEEATHLMTNFPPVDVFLTHCPPLGVNDDQADPVHIGFEALRTYVLEKHPRYLLHGHTYPTPETLVRSLGETEIIYVNRDRFITLS